MFKFISLSQAASVYAAAFSSLSLTNKFFIAAVFVSLALAGCGGGGVGSSSASTSGSQPIYGGDIGGGNVDAGSNLGGGIIGDGGNQDTAPSQPSEPSQPVFDPTYTIGTSSTQQAALGNLFFGNDDSLSYVANNGRFYQSLAEAHNTLSPDQTMPIASQDTNAYVQWQNGWTGKNVAIGIVDSFSNNRSVDTHGEKVALIANSVAPQAEIVNYHFNYSIAGAERAWEKMNAAKHFIANNSFGASRYDPSNGREDKSFDNKVANWVKRNYKATGPADYDDKMLFVFAAGNGGRFCPDRRVHACTFRAAVTYELRQKGQEDTDAMIWVGSLTDSGGRLTSYSLTAGEMKHDFIVAHNDVLSKGDGSGTSYAAPRVSGAAATIRQKFPRLSGFQLKSLLLETATDMGEAGVDEIYGHGKLDLSNALSPQGQLSVN